MPIHVPGKRDRNGRLKAEGRSAVAVLQLTAMVDMFTVLAVFLLQNYATTGEVIHIPKGVELPRAADTKELQPANVVVITRDKILFNDEAVANFLDVREQIDKVVEPLKSKVLEMIEKGELEKSTIAQRLKRAVKKTKSTDPKEESDIDSFRRITLQADKGIDFLTVKKIMRTVTEAGIYEINFAVIKKEKRDERAISL